jgi:hypothetical protein
MLEVLLAVLATTMAPISDATPESPATWLEVCDAGGWRAETCSLTCHRAFNYWVTTCNVSCRSGYYACCGCDRGCQCVIDHDELWPLPPDPTPQPDPEPEDDVALE